MELKLIHILGPILATVGMLFYGNIMVRRKEGRSINVFPALVMIGGAILFRQFTGDGTFLDRVCLTLLDFGIAMIIDSRYLKAKNNHPKVFWVPGVLALIVSFGLYFIASLFGWTVNGMFDESESPVQDIKQSTLVEPGKKAQVLLELGPDDKIEELNKTLVKFEAVFEDAFPEVDLGEDEDLAQVFLVTLPAQNEKAFLEAVRKDVENVDYAEHNYELRLDLPADSERKRVSSNGGFLASDPAISQQWWLPTEQANAMHSMLKDHPPAKKAIVAIVDTGVDNKHEDLKGVFGGRSGRGDQHGHGTHCAGLAGANTNNALGIASLNWEGRFIEIRGYRGLDKNGSGTVSRVAKAIIKAADEGADVISLSLGSYRPRPHKSHVDAIDYALQRGCIVVAAAGNSHGQDAKLHSPANIDGVIVVSAIAQNQERSPFSNVNTSLAMPLGAPGSNIYSTFPNSEYKSMNGTSMATPIVAGLLGIARAYRPDITAKEAWQLLHDHGESLPASEEVGQVIDQLKTVQTLTGQNQ